MSQSNLPDDIVGDAYTSTFSWDVLTDLTEIGNRMAGQAGEKDGARIIADAFEEAGLRGIQLEEFDIPGWWRDSATLTVDTSTRNHTFDRQHELIGLPGTPAGDVESDLVDLGYGLPEEIGPEVDGKIVLVRSDTPETYDRWIHRMEKYASAAESGAAGFVFRNHVDGCLPPTGEVGYHNRPGPIPAVGVSKEVGARLARYCEDRTPTVRLAVDCRNQPTTSVNTEGVVGPDTDEEVLVTAHVDCHDIAEGAGDNGSGCALVAEIGRLLTHVEDKLDTTVRLIAFGSEEIGLYGAYHHAETHNPDAIKCVLNLDEAGDSRYPKVHRTNGFDSMRTPFEAAAESTGIPIEIEGGVSPHGDSWPFVERGIPAVTAGSAAEGSGRGWGHTHADTLDKLDPQDLRTLAVAFATTVLELADDDREFSHKAPSEIEGSIDENYERELRAGGRWHFDS